ncbi:Uncharacterised protein [Mycobacteroides abscessus subsp. abscessus]|nr:Uncharacterised protein [Mycobacteroides abscessus subsp. abscessus]
MRGVDVRLPLNDLSALLERADLSVDSFAVVVEDPETVVFVARSLADQGGEALEFGQWHAGFAEADTDLQPFEVGSGVDASTARRPVDGGDEKIHPLVVPQGVHTHSRLLGHVADRVRRRFAVVTHRRAPIP